MVRDRRRAARRQLPDGLERNACARAGASALQPVFRSSDRGRQCRGDHLEGNGAPRHLQASPRATTVRRRRPAFGPRFPNSPTPQALARSLARAGVVVNARAAADEAALVAERSPELRADVALSRPADLDLPQGRERAIAARLLRPLEGKALHRDRATPSPSPTSPASTRRRRNWRRSSTSSAAPADIERSADAFRTAFC